MNKIVEKIFKHYKPNYNKMQKYGFTWAKDAYLYTTDIMDGQFYLTVKITDADIDTEVIDLSTNEQYTLFLADGASGSFVGAMRTAYENALQDIVDNCCDKCIFKSTYANEIIKYVTEIYGDELEFLWEKFDDNAIWRRKDNKKWYGLLLTVAKSKLGLESDEKIEIIDLRVDANNIDTIVDNKTVFPGYHMNKKHWITICLDGSVPLKDIEKLLDASYQLARKS